MSALREVWSNLRTAAGVRFIFFALAGLAFLLQAMTEGIPIGGEDRSLRIWASVVVLGLGAAVFWFMPRQDHEGEFTVRELQGMIAACILLAIALPQAANRLFPRGPALAFELPVTDTYTTYSRKRLLRPQTRYGNAITIEPLPPHDWLYIPASSLRVERGECLKAIVRFGLLGENWISHLVPIPCSPERGTPAPVGNLTIAWHDGFDSWVWTTSQIEWGAGFEAWRDELLGELLSLPPPADGLAFEVAVAADASGNISAPRLIRPSGYPEYDAAVLHSLARRDGLLTPRAVKMAEENGIVVLPAFRFQEDQLYFNESMVIESWDE